MIGFYKLLMWANSSTAYLVQAPVTANDKSNFQLWAPLPCPGVCRPPPPHTHKRAFREDWNELTHTSHLRRGTRG